MNKRKFLEVFDGKLNIVGKNIKLHRKLNNNMSRQQLSDKLILYGIALSAHSIFDIEKNNRTVVDYELCAIAKILNTTSDELMRDFKENYLDNC